MASSTLPAGWPPQAHAAPRALVSAGLPAPEIVDEATANTFDQPDQDRQDEVQQTEARDLDRYRVNDADLTTSAP